jgi:hypothetical protein
MNWWGDDSLIEFPWVSFHSGSDLALRSPPILKQFPATLTARILKQFPNKVGSRNTQSGEDIEPHDWCEKSFPTLDADYSRKYGKIIAMVDIGF